MCSVPKVTTRPDVVAGQIHQHDVLGQFLGVLDELGLETLVLGGVGAAPTGPGNGTRRDHAVAQLHHWLGRRPHDRALVAAQEVQVRAGIDQAEDTVEVEGIGLEIEVEALG